MNKSIFLLSIFLFTACDLEDTSVDSEDAPTEFRDADLDSLGQFIGKAVRFEPYLIEAYHPLQKLIFKINPSTGYIAGSEKVYFDFPGCVGSRYYSIAELSFCPALSPSYHVLFTDSDKYGQSFPLTTYETTGAPFILQAGGSYLEDGQCYNQLTDVCVLSTFISANNGSWPTPINLIY
jgi:hypothetical protein